MNIQACITKEQGICTIYLNKNCNNMTALYLSIYLRAEEIANDERYNRLT